MSVALENANTNSAFWRQRCLKAEATNTELLAALQAMIKDADAPVPGMFGAINQGRVAVAKATLPR